MRPGDRLGGHFEIIREIGRGGFGGVYTARDLNLGRHVAIKVLGIGGERRLSDDLLRLFDREAKATARLNHPNVVTVFDSGVHQGKPYLVLELLRGETLAQRLERGPLPQQEVVGLAIQIARGLAHAHAAGVLHLDLKPHNLFLTEEGLLKILDLGMAALDLSRESLLSALRQTPEETQKKLARSVSGGTPAYMAPEQWRGEPVDARTDVWALGVILFESLTGKNPCRLISSGTTATDPAVVPSVKDLEPGVVEDLERIVARALVKNPEGRFASADELLDALTSVEQVLAGPAPETEAPYRYLEPFTEVRAAWFFGRAREVRRLGAMLETRPLVAVVGASGAGKTSLIRAGLIPRLHRSGPWTVISMRPGGAPFQALRGRLAALCPDIGRTDLQNRPGQVGQLLRSEAARHQTRILLFVDQFEELYAQVPDAARRRAFAAALLSAADDGEAPVRVLLAIRSDFVHELTEDRRLRDQVTSNILLLGPPDGDEMTESLVEPARRLGFSYEEGLAADIIHPLEDHPAPLPLLQLAASRLWDKRDVEHRRLSRRVLDRLGGVGGVLAAHSEEILEDLPGADERALAREILVTLVTPEGTRRQLSRAQLLCRFEPPDSAMRVLEHLLCGRLVTSFKRDDEPWVELAHESLLEHWARFRGWLDEEREHMRFHERVSHAADLWSERDRPRDLLWTKDELRDAIRWRAEMHTALRPVERAFLDAAQALAQRRRRQRRWLQAGGALLALAAVVGSLLATRAAREAARSARTRAIVSAASAARDPYLAALLLLELPLEPEPPGAATVAYRVLGRSRPAAVLRHRTKLVDAVFSRDGGRIATASQDPHVRVWPADGRKPPRLLRGLANEVGGVVFGPRARRLLAWSGNQALIWSTENAGQTVALIGHTAPIWSATFSPDGRSVATASFDRTIRVWNVRRPAEPRILSGHSNAVMDVAFSPDGTKLASVSMDRTVRIWVRRHPDAAWATWRVLRGHRGMILMVRFNTAGALLATASLDGTARIWPGDGDGPSRVLAGHNSAVRTAVFSPDGTRVLTASDDGTARVWTLAGGSPPLVLRGHTSAVLGAEFSPDGERIVTASGDRTARVWRANGTGRPVILGGHGGRVLAAHFSHGGTRIVTASADGTARVWSGTAPKEPVVIGTAKQPSSVVFSPDGSTLITTHVDGTAQIHATNGFRNDVTLRGHRGPIAWAAISPDGLAIATASTDRTARLWSVEGGKPGRVFRGHERLIRHVTFSPDSSLLATSSDDATVRLWRVSGGGAPVVLRHPAHVYRAAFSPDGSRIVTSCYDGNARVWPVDGTGHPRVLRGHKSPVLIASFDRTGNRVLTGSVDGTARIWPLDGSGREIVLRGHGRALTAASFSLDGSRVVTAAYDGTARVWRAGGEGEAVVLRGHRGKVTAAQFTRDGKRIITAGIDESVRIWDVNQPADSIVLDGLRGLQGVAVAASTDRIAVVSQEGWLQIWSLRGWPELRAMLGAAIRDCLPLTARTTLLGESVSVAATRREACMVSVGRTGAAGAEKGVGTGTRRKRGTSKRRRRVR